MALSAPSSGTLNTGLRLTPQLQITPVPQRSLTETLAEILKNHYLPSIQQLLNQPSLFFGEVRDMGRVVIMADWSEKLTILLATKGPQTLREVMWALGTRDKEEVIGLARMLDFYDEPYVRLPSDHPLASGDAVSAFNGSSPSGLILP